MNSVILTKVSKENLSFSQQISANVGKGKGDFEFLKEFVKHVHPKSDLTIDLEAQKIEAHSTKASFAYSISYTHIIRATVGSNINSKSANVYYRVS